MKLVGTTVSTFQVAHSADGLEQLVARLCRLGDPAELPVAIERPDGRLVDRLLEAGHPVVPVQANAIKAWRDAEGPVGRQERPGRCGGDRRVPASARHRLRVLRPFSPATRALRAVVRTRGDLVEARVTATNQLAACLEAFWPGARQVFADVESPIALGFLARFATPESAERLGEARMQAFCTKHGYSGRRPAAQLLAHLRAALAGLVGTVEVEARRDAVLALVGVLRALNQAIKQLDRSVIAHLGEHPDAEIFTSLPRSGRISAAQVLAEWGDRRAAYDHPDAVAALSSVVPVTKASGKHRTVSFRWACNKRFRAAITGWADNSRHASPWAAKVYADAVARGCDHPHAVRILARAWVRVIWRCWVDQVPYDPAKHGAARRLAEMTASAA
jgi:transposase